MKMYIYFDRNGTIKEVINDESIRRGSSDYNKIYCYLEGNPDIDDIWYLQKNVDGSLTNEISFKNSTVTKAIPYDAKRDMRYFKDFETYTFYVFTLTTNYLKQSGLVSGTIRIEVDNEIFALGELKFNVQENVINTSNGITQSQYDYLLLAYASRTLNEQTGSDLDHLLDEKIDAKIGDIADGSPKVFDTTEHIQALTSDMGLAVATDTGYIWVWNDTDEEYKNTNYVYLANVSAYYTKTEVNSALALKADKSDVDILNNRMSLIDGVLTYVDLEIGYIGYSESGLSYTPSGNRCRTPQGVYYHLKVGDIVTFNTFTNKRFLLYYELNNVYYSLGWQTSAYTITIEANYYIMCSYINQQTITDISEFYDLHIASNSFFEKEISEKVDNNYNELTTRLNYDKYLPDGTPNTQAFSLVNGLYLSKDLSNHITDIKRNTDLLVHCSSNVIIGTMVYVLFYYNSVSTSENPSQLSICLCYFDITTPNDKTYIDIAKIGDSFDNTTFDKLYDCSLFNDNGVLKIIFNAHLATDTQVTKYYNIYKTYDTSTGVLSNANYCIFKLGNATYNFSGSNIQLAFYNAGHQLSMYVYGQLTINSRCTLYNNYYYVGMGCVTTFNCILKTDDFITFEYVSTPSFYSISGGEEVCYVKNNKCYYYMRQKDTSCYGILSYYDLVNDKWSDPVYIPDTQSRADFFEYNSKLYLMHSPINRSNIEIIQLNETELKKSEKVSCAYLDKSFYPYTLIYNNELYMTFTNDRKHLYFAKYQVQYETNGSIVTKLKNLFNVF